MCVAERGAGGWVCQGAAPRVVSVWVECHLSAPLQRFWALWRVPSFHNEWDISPSDAGNRSLAGCSCHSSTLKILSSSCFVTALFKRNIKATYKLKFSNITVKIGEVNFNNTLLFNLKDRKQYFKICMFLFKKLLMRLSWPSKTAGSSPVDSTHGSKMLGGTVGWGTVPCSRKAMGERQADQEGALRSPPAHCLLPTPLCPNPMGSHPASLPV